MSIKVRVFKSKSDAQKYAKKMNASARTYRYEVRPYLTGYGQIQGYKVRKVKK